jgi:hypothetical protein
MDDADYPNRYDTAHRTTREGLHKLARANGLRIKALSVGLLAQSEYDRVFAVAIKLEKKGASELGDGLASYPKDFEIDRQ